MATYNPFKHDVGLITTSFSSGIGLTLLRDKDGKPAYAEFDDEILASQWFSGAPDYSYRPPAKEIIFVKDNWRGGFGPKYFDSNDPKRYRSSKNCDARFGNVIAGPLGTTVTKPTAQTYYAVSDVTDGGLEVWTGSNGSTDLTNWTEAKGPSTDAKIVQEATTKRTGSYSCKIYKLGASAAQYGEITQTIAWHNEYRGHYFTFTAYCHSNTANTFFIRIDYGTGTEDSSFDVGNTTWNQLSVTKQLPSDATQLIVSCEMIGADAGEIGYFDDCALTSIYSEAVVGVSTVDTEFNDKHYKSFGNILAERTADNFTYVFHFPATITDLCPFTISATAYLYIALGDSNELWYMTTAQAFTESAGDEMVYFLAASPSTLYGIKQADFTLRKTTVIDTWSTVTGVGHPYDNQTDLLIDEANYVIVGKEDMPYYIDSSNNDQALMPTLKVMKSSTSCKNMFAWHGKIYIQAGDQSLFEFSGTPGSATAVKKNISPAHYMEGLDDFNGSIQAITGDDEYLYVVMDDGTDIQILAGRWESVDGVTDWRWHPIAELELDGCETTFVSSVSKKRLWISSTLAANNLTYFPLTTKYGDIANDTNYTYQGDGEFIETWIHNNLKGDNKALYSITATLGHSHDTAIYFEVHYKKWGDADWTDIGDLVGTATDRTHTLYFPDENSNHPVSKFFDIKFVPKLDSPYTTSPILENYEIRGAWQPARRQLIACAVVSDEDFVLQDGQIGKGVVADVKTAIDEAKAATWPLTFYDIDGSTITVNLLPTRPSYVTEIEHISDQRKVIKRVYELLLQKVTLE